MEQKYLQTLKNTIDLIQNQMLYDNVGRLLHKLKRFLLIYVTCAKQRGDCVSLCLSVPWSLLEVML